MCTNMYSLEEGHNLGGEFFCCPESLRVQHDLCNELAVRLRHGQTAEQLLQVIRQVGSTSIARVHGDEDGHIRAHLHLLAYQLYTEGLAS